MGDNQFVNHPRELKTTEVDHHVQVDSRGSRFVNDCFRWAQPITPAVTDLPVSPSDAISLSAAATVTGLLADQDGTDTPAAYALPAGITRLSFRRVTVLSTGTATALYIRRPAGA